MPSGSSPLAGSSRTSRRGRPSSAPARPRRWRIPSENPPTRRSAAPARSTSRSTSAIRASSMPAAAATIRRCWRAVRHGWKVAVSSTAPTVPSGSSSSAYWRPKIVAIPELGVASPSSMRRVVVFPAPFGPRKPVTAPGWISKERSSTATVGP